MSSHCFGAQRARAHTLCALLFTGPAATACSGDDGLQRFVRDTYGERIEFDVLRNGRPVGRHVTSFALRGSQLAVASRMQIAIAFLRIPVYAFDYATDSLWCDGVLHALEAKVSDNGQLRTLAVTRRAGRLELAGAAGSVAVAGDLLPTEHWDPRVLGATAVINTLTGRVNTIRLERCDAAPPGAAGVTTATCYDYTGDLAARVWYDHARRWVGLAFRGSDGSDIVYVCRTCAGAP